MRPSIFVYILYIVTLISTVFYLIQKYRKCGYIFSFFNASYFFYIISVFIAGPFQYLDDAWIKLFVTTPSIYNSELNEIYIINLLGLLIMNICVCYFEFGNTDKLPGYRIAKSISNSMSYFVFNLYCFIMCVLLFMLLVKYNDGYLPIIRGNRNFYLNQSFSYIYQICVYGITFCSVIYAFRIKYRKQGIVMLLISLVFIFGTGTRTVLINYVLYPLFLFVVYFNTRRGRDYSKRATTHIILICIALLMLALWMIAFRDKKINFNYLNEIIYGNTFCDIRDGAFLLKHYRQRFGRTPLFGKTYLAALLSFLPSSVSAFKYNWGWARFSTIQLIGWTNHTGFHAGNSTEAYFNFGWCGVIITSVIKAYLFAAVEKIFKYKIFYNIYEEHEFNYLILLPLFLMTNFYSFFNVTSNGNIIMAFVTLIFANIFATSILKNR